MGILKLWQWIEEGRGVHGHADARQPTAHKLSNRQQEQRLRDSFVNVRRVREWRDIHSQLHTVVAEHGWRLNAQPATYEQMHLSMLAGPAGQHRLEERRRRVVPRRARHQVLAPPRRAPEQEAGPLDRRRRAGGDDAAVRPRPGRDRAAVDAGDRRPSAEDAAARAALGEEGRRSDRAGARHALRHRRLQQQARALRPASTRSARARSSSARRWSPASGTRGCRSWRTTGSWSRRSRNSSTRRGARTCWSTTS